MMIPIAKIRLDRMTESARRLRIAALIQETKETILRVQTQIHTEKSHAPSTADVARRKNPASLPE
jgi:hypothetical protein